MSLSALVLAALATAAAAAPAVDDAEAAWARGDLAAAEAGLTAYLVEHPEDDHALRRLCGVVLAAERPEDAVVHCRAAVRLKPTVEARTALAMALIAVGRLAGAAEEPSELAEARQLLDAVLSEQPDQRQAWPALADLAVLTADVETLARAVEHLAKTRPDEKGTFYYRALLQAERGQIQEATRSLDKARGLGLEDDLYRPVAQRLSAAPAPAEASGEATPSALFTVLPWVVVIGLAVASMAMVVSERPTAPRPGPPPAPPPAPPSEGG
jgi:predicted Zn-dependent protease